MSQRWLSSSPGYDCGAGDIYGVEDLRTRPAVESLAQHEIPEQSDKGTPQNDEPPNLMTSGDARDTPCSPDVAEACSLGFQKADIDALEAELLGAQHTTELCRLRVESLKKELKETKELCERLADLPNDWSDDEELADCLFMISCK